MLHESYFFFSLYNFSHFILIYFYIIYIYTTLMCKSYSIYYSLTNLLDNNIIFWQVSYFLLNYFSMVISIYLGTNWNFSFKICTVYSYWKCEKLSKMKRLSFAFIFQYFVGHEVENGFFALHKLKEERLSRQDTLIIPKGSK